MSLFLHNMLLFFHVDDPNVNEPFFIVFYILSNMSGHFRVRSNENQPHFVFYFVKDNQSLVFSGTFGIGQYHLPVTVTRYVESFRG